MNRIRAIRCFSAVAAPHSTSKGSISAALDPGQWNHQSLRNGAVQLVVAPTVPESSQYSVGAPQVTLYLQAGARHERYDQGEQGLAHLLRRSIGFSTADAFGLGVVRSLQQMGASLNCSSSREHLVFSLRLSEENWAKDGVKYLDLLSTQCLFNHWELLRYAYPSMKEDVANLKRRDFDLLLSELLHKAAFRSQGLGHSLFAPEFLLEQYEPHEHSFHHSHIDRPLCDVEVFPEQAIESFVQRRILQQPAILVLTGISEKLANGLRDRIESGERFSTLTGSGDTSAHQRSENKSADRAQFHSGDERHENHLIDYGLVALGWPGPKYGHDDEVAAGILQRALTGGSIHKPRAHRGSFQEGLLWEKLLSDDSLTPMAVAGLQWAYADQGLFGVQLTGSNKNGALGKAVRLFAHEIKRVSQNGLTDQQLARAKTAFKSDLLLSMESSSAAAFLAGEVLSFTGSLQSIDKQLSQVEKITAADVKKVAGQIFGHKTGPAVAAVGDIHGVPYPEELSK